MDIAVIENEVKTLLGAEGSGHDWEHVRRVTAIARRLAVHEKADVDLVVTIALLHDVDDRKITGDINSEKELPTLRRIMKLAGAPASKVEAVVDIIHSLGFHKSLEGKLPATIEAQVVSDADYLDAMGAIGIARCCTFGGAKGLSIFNPQNFPKTDKTRDEYVAAYSPTSVNHFFEKLLKLKDLMHTTAGKAEADKRHQFMVEYLRTLFEETDAPPEWKDLLQAAA